MNKIYKVVKDKVCGEYARSAGKGLASVTVVALASFGAMSQANSAMYIIDPAQVSTGTPKDNQVSQAELSRLYRRQVYLNQAA